MHCPIWYLIYATEKEDSENPNCGRLVNIYKWNRLKDRYEPSALPPSTKGTLCPTF